MEERDFVGPLMGTLLGVSLQFEARAQWCLPEPALATHAFLLDPRVQPSSQRKSLALDRFRNQVATANDVWHRHCRTPSAHDGLDGVLASTFQVPACQMVQTADALDEVGEAPVAAAHRRVDCGLAPSEEQSSVQFGEGNCTAVVVAGGFWEGASANRTGAKVSFRLPVQTIEFHPADRLPHSALSQRVQPTWASTAPVRPILRHPKPLSIEVPAGPGTQAKGSRPSMVSDLQAMIASHVPLSPGWIRGPLVHMPPFESRWLSAFFPQEVDRRRFTVLECRLDYLTHGARAEWSLLDYVYAALRAVTYRVKAVWYVVHPLPGLPVPQLVLTASNAPPGFRTIPVDLRPLDGLLHSIEVDMRSDMRSVWTALREKGVDPTGRLEQAWRSGQCVFETEEGQPVLDLRHHTDSLEWLQLRATNPEAPAGIVVDYVGGMGAVLRVPAPVAPPDGMARTTLTTTAAQPVTFHSQSLSVAEVTIHPEDLAGAADRTTVMDTLPGLKFFLKERMPAQRHYALFERTRHLHIRALSENWCLDDLVRDVMAVVPMLRSIQILQNPLDRLPIFQVVATDLGWPMSSAAVPFDLRGAGMAVCTLVVGPGMPQRILHEATWAACANGRSGIPDNVPFVDTLGNHGDTCNPITDAQFYAPSFPAVWSHDPAVTGVATDESEGSLSPGGAAALPCAISTTTSTTGAMQWAGLRITQQGVNRTADFLLARHVQLTVFTVHSIEYGPHSPMGSPLADTLAPLLAQVLQRGHGPRLGYIQATRVLPMPQGDSWLVPVIWAERTGAHVHVLLDTRCGGGDIQLLTVPIGTTASQVLPFHFQSQGWAISANGIGSASFRRPLESGDILQLSRPGKPVPGFHFGHAVNLMPHLRVLTLPISLIDARPVPQQLTLAQSRDNAGIMHTELTRHINARLHLMGSADPQLRPVTIMGLHHGPILLYLPGPEPTLEHAQIVLNSIPEFPSGLQVYESDAFLGDVGVFVTAEPDAGTVTALVASTIGFGLDNLIVVPLLHTQQQLGAAVYLDPFYVAEPFRNPRNGHYIRRTRISLPGDGVALAHVTQRTDSCRQQRICDRAQQLGLERSPCRRAHAGSGIRAASPAEAVPQAQGARDHLVHNRGTSFTHKQPEPPAIRPQTVPTPQGRRTLRANPSAALGCNSLDQGPNDGGQTATAPPLTQLTGDSTGGTLISLEAAISGPASGAAWGVNQEVVEHALDAHHLPIPDLVSVARSLPVIASRTWCLLDAAPAQQQFDAVILYTDGSFMPGLPQASWAFVAVGKYDDRLLRIGSLAGRIPAAEVPSAYRGELWALTHALAFVAANQVPHAVLASDCQAALDVAFGKAQSAEEDPVGLAAQSLLFLCRTCGLDVRPLKVEAHSGIPMNEAADAVAKTANLQNPDRLFAFDAEVLHSCITDGTVHRLWLVYSGRRMSAQLPTLDAQGCWSLPACGFPQSTRAGSSSVSATRSVPLTWRLSFGLITYNCLSARSQPARELLDSGLHKRKCALAGLQEGRSLESGITHTAHYWVASSSCDEQGGGGCQVWISKTLAWGRSQSTDLRPHRESFSLLLAEPRLLIVLLRVGQLKFACVAAHAPTTASGPQTCKKWWRHLQTQCKKVPPGHVLLMMVDANASFTQAGPTGDTLTAVPTSENAKQLQEFCAQTGLQPTAQCDRHRAPLYSWTSPDGDTRRLIDYVCVPTEWKQGLQTEPPFSLNDLRAGYDHEPIQGTVGASISAPQSPARRRVPVEALQTDEGRRTAAAAMASVPAISWDVDATTHMDLILGHIFSFLQTHLPAAPPRSRNPVLSETSLRLVRARREVRTVKRRLDKAYRQGLLFQCFAAWCGRTGVVQAQVRRLDSLAHRVSRAGFSLAALHRAIGESFSADQANFARKAMEQSRAGGASDFAHSIRALLRSGRRFRAPQLLHSISDGQSTAACDTDILDMLGRHFAGPERAHQSHGSELLTHFDQAKPLRPGLDMTTLPHVADLISATMAQKSGKAAGISGIPAELYKADAVTAAQLLFPVLAKSVVRGCGPMQHNGGLARAIPKSKLQAGTPAGWRSILLLEPSGKIIQKAYRKQLIVALEQYKSRNQFGGLPKRRLEEPSVIVRAHFARLRTRQQTGGALFIDSRAAYYSLVRDALVESCTCQDDSLLWRRARQLFPFPDDQQSYVRHMQAGGLVKALQLPAPLVRYLESQLGTTWFSMTSPITTAYISGSGTAPGSPIADLLFSFVYARFLNHAEELLLSEGHFVALCPEVPPAVMPTWADDTAALIGPLPPAALALTLRRVTELVSDGLSGHGLDPNFGPGKTEAVVHFSGSGSQAARRALLCTEEPGVSFRKRPDKPCTLRLVPTYVHLGTVVSHNALETPNLHYRAMLLRQLFVPLRKRLLFNRNLTKAEKIRILEERALPKFLFGAGLWTLRTTREQELAVEPIHKAFRQAFRPILGVSSEGFTNDEIAAALGLPTAAQYLDQAQAAALLHLARTASEEVCVGLQVDGIWHGQAWQALRRVLGEKCPVALCLSQPPGLRDLLAMLPVDCDRVCRNYLRVCQQGGPHVDLRPRSAAVTEAPSVLATAHSALSHVCATCGLAFLNARRLAVHRARKHGELSIGTTTAWGTRCEKCGVEFWHPCRLAQHLNRSQTCRQVYVHSDLQPSQPQAVGKTPPAWQPAVKTAGPRPFWADLDPRD